MSIQNWKDILAADATDWLLEEDNPSIRYFTLVDILDKPLDFDKVIDAQQDIMRVGIVPKILATQKEGGYWEKPEDFYIRTKFKGTVWQMIILAELGADGTDSRIQRTCEFILDWSQDRKSGGFAYQGSKKGGGFHSGVIPCLTGNMIWSLIRFGYLDDPRVRQGIDWITDYTRYDDGADVKLNGWPFEKRRACWGKHTCHLTVVKALKALAEIPEEKRSPEMKHVIKHGAEYLLVHHLFKRSHDIDSIAKPKWTKLGFPWMWDTDVLEMLLILIRLGYRDNRMKDALDLVISKQDTSGRWVLEHSYNERFQVNIERKGKPSKWITLNALKVLKHLEDLLDHR
jgi:hypothetical protein